MNITYITTTPSLLLKSLTPEQTTTLTPSLLKSLKSLLHERKSLESAGLLSANTKSINLILGKSLSLQVKFSNPTTTTPSLTPSPANLATLTSKREQTPPWEPGKRAALTKQINAMTLLLKASA